MVNKINNYITGHEDLLLQTLKELCCIPAPSHQEQKRAEYCKNWLDHVGATGVYIDETLNVVFPLNCKNSNKITVFAAHTDTVFPDTSPMPFLDDGIKIHCPGAADDTSGIAVLLLMAKYFIDNRLAPSDGILFLFNSCEEGLGNLKGTRHFFKEYGTRVARFITFDSDLDIVNDRCVGSHRYHVQVTTKGGHSFEDFGQTNAIAKLSELVNKIYALDVPCKEGSHTTYNVGTISGGTSVNTIAQKAEMLCEYRSDDAECLAAMQSAFYGIFENAKTPDTDIQIALVGDRPCSSTDPCRVDELKQLVVPIIEKVIKRPVLFRSASTDCNIPLSINIPAICIGVNHHSGIHTREEWVEKKSLFLGLEVAINAGCSLLSV